VFLKKMKTNYHFGKRTKPKFLYGNEDVFFDKNEDSESASFSFSKSKKRELKIF